MAESQQRQNGFAMAVLVEGGLALVAMLLAWIFRAPLREQIPASIEQLAYAVMRGVLVTLPMFAVFLWLVHSSWTTLRELRQQVEWLVAEMFPAASPAQFALVALLAGVGEELLFRGVIQTICSRWTTPIAGLIIASLLFGAAHALTKLYFFLATAIGVCFGALVLQYNDLVAPMVAHSLYDFFALSYLSRRVRLGGSSSPPPEWP
jgi:membrane protease YdiL (CAAX protease family)